jgi:hypothetical protein
LYNNQWNGKKNRNDQSLLHGKALQPNANAIMPRVLLVSSPFGANMPKKAPKRDGGHRQNDPMLMVCPQPTNYRGAIIEQSRPKGDAVGFEAQLIGTTKQSKQGKAAGR